MSDKLLPSNAELGELQDRTDNDFMWVFIYLFKLFFLSETEKKVLSCQKHKNKLSNEDIKGQRSHEVDGATFSDFKNRETN